MKIADYYNSRIDRLKTAIHRLRVEKRLALLKEKERELQFSRNYGLSQNKIKAAECLRK